MVASGRTMKISIIYDFLKEFGGLERVLFFQARVLSKKFKPELKFSFIGVPKHNDIGEQMGEGVDVRISQIGGGRSEFLELVRSFLFPSRVNQLKTDLIISHSFMATRMAYYFKKKRIPYIVMIHHPPNFLYNRSLLWANNPLRFIIYVVAGVIGGVLRAVDRKVVGKADCVIANSEFTARRVEDIYGICPEVIYPSVSSRFKRMDSEAAQKILARFQLSPRTILLHGRMIKDKRPEWAIKAFSRIQHQIPHMLVVTGTIEARKRLDNLISELNIQQRVRILGRISDEELVALYSSASCFLMSAPREDFGLTPVEAMSCGCPVVGWKDGAGPEETIIDGTSGFLAKPYLIDDYSEKIKEATNKEWDINAIVFHAKKYSEDSIAAGFLKIVEKVIQSSESGRITS